MLLDSVTGALLLHGGVAASLAGFTASSFLYDRRVSQEAQLLIVYADAQREGVAKRSASARRADERDANTRARAGVEDEANAMLQHSCTVKARLRR